MSEFKISAPGRIVLNGDYAAMYEKHVVMASLNQYTTVKFSELIDGSREIKIEFPDVALSLNVSLELVLNFFSGNNSFDMTLYHCRLLRLVRSLITLNGMWKTQEQRFSLQTFFFLLLIIAYNEKFVIKSFHVHVSTELPIGAGFGSSSSFAVCLAACFLHWTRLQNGAHSAFNEQELTIIYNYAMYCERISQNYMFGADNYVCSYGKIIKSRYEHDNYYNDIINMTTMQILLIDTNIRQKKGERAKQVAELKHSSHEFDVILNLFDLMSCQIFTTLNEINDNEILYRNPDFLQLQQYFYAGLQIYIQNSHHMLHHLGLSHPRFDTIASIAGDFGFGGKLTGFGGGFAYILLPPIVSEEQITYLSTRFREEGFDITRTSVSCNGVRIDA